VASAGYDEREIYFLSDTDGTLTVEADLEGEGLQTFDTISVSAGTPEFWMTDHELARMRFSFDTAATVTLKIMFR